MNKWEKIDVSETGDCMSGSIIHTTRLAVPGGYLYKIQTYHQYLGCTESRTESLCFVPNGE